MTKDILLLLGTHIRKLRGTKGYSQEGFASEIGFGRAYYSGVERGKHNISALNLIKIAQKLNVSVGDLFPPEVYKNKLYSKIEDSNEA